MDAHDIQVRLPAARRAALHLSIVLRRLETWVVAGLVTAFPLGGAKPGDTPGIADLAPWCTGSVLVILAITVLSALRSEQSYPTDGTIRISELGVEIAAANLRSRLNWRDLRWRRRAGGIALITRSGGLVAWLDGSDLTTDDRALLASVRTLESPTAQLPRREALGADQHVIAWVDRTNVQLNHEIRDAFRHMPAAYLFTIFFTLAVVMGPFAIAHGLTLAGTMILLNGAFLYVHCGPDLLLRGPTRQIRQRAWLNPAYVAVSDFGITVAHGGGAEQFAWSFVRLAQEGDRGMVLLLGRCSLYVPHGAITDGTLDELRALIRTHVAPSKVRVGAPQATPPAPAW